MRLGDLDTLGDVPLGTADRGLRPAGTTEITAPLFEPVKVAVGTLLDRRVIPVMAFEHAFDVAVTGFSAFAGGGGSITAEDLQRHLRSPAFIEQLDSAREKVREELDVERSVTISVAGVSLGVSVAYILWLIRGGVLMGSYLSALPAWRLLDPLPVLSRVEDEADEEDEVLDADAQRPGDALRGFH